MDDEAVASFVAATGASDSVARTYLELANGNLQQAAELYFDQPNLVQPEAQELAATEATPAPLSVGRQDAQGVIHIDSDDDDDVQMLGDDDDGDFGLGVGGAAAEAATVARSAQEEEDAAMAKRLQEELYGESATMSDDIRAPIARTTETLVAPPGYGGGPAEDLDDEMGPAILGQIRRRNQRRAPANNPFSQSVWESEEPPAYPRTEVPSQSSRQARLAELYRPPHELISHATWDEARLQGREDMKWILANIQDMADFTCQVLNRDIWKDEAIQQIVSENFIFLQYSKADYEAKQYIQYYLPEGRDENPDNYPHVAIIDPRTGEQVKVWSGRPFPDALDFHAQLAEFLDRYSLSANSKNPVAKVKPKAPPKDLGRMTEEEMLQMAMQNSLETANGGSSSSVPTVHDPDDLTAAALEAGKGKQRSAPGLIDLTDSEDAQEAPEPPAQSAFAKIPGDRPHAEPANDPASTTRIQFRHAAGRVIRRFAVGDPVIRIYEWLKAEPLEGKEGVEFELKMMPQGQDLIEALDKTIEEAGLKQATVMIEFVEP